MLRTYRSGEIEYLTEKSPIMFTGLLIEKRHDGAITLSQTHNDDELIEIHPADFALNNQIGDAGKLRTALRQALGSLIWLHQTRPDIGYDIARIATEAVAACTAPNLALQCVALCNKTVRFAQIYARKIAYAPSHDQLSTPSARLQHQKNRRLIIFNDSGFGSLSGSRSVKGSVAIIGQVVSRGWSR